MAGFFLHIGENKKVADISYPTNEYRNENYYLHYDDSKFSNDTFYFQDEEVLIILYGVVFNSLKLKSDQNWPLFVKRSYQLKGDSFYNDFRGSFSGALLDKQASKWIIFTDQIGDKQLFYSQVDNCLVVSSTITDIVSYFRSNKLSYNLDEKGAYFLLTYGYMIENYTLFKEIHKLNAGKYLKLFSSQVSINKYFEFSNNTNALYWDEELAIKDFNYYFEQAVERQFSKDCEYNYAHITSLSGGLDSRMTSWVAHELGYVNQLNFTFSQTNYLDEVIAKKIASDLKHDWLFKSLDNGLFLTTLDDVTNVTFGNVLYYTLAHEMSFASIVNLEKYGIVHTGQIGEGTYYWGRKEETKYSVCDGKWAYSSFLLHRLSNEWIKNAYPNEEIFHLYGRGFTGGNQGVLCWFEKGETFSPFYDVDFLNFYLSIPLQLRLDHNIYHKWMIKYHKSACKYIWEHSGTRVDSIKINLFGHKLFWKELIRKIDQKISLKYNISFLNKTNSPKGMNPLTYWYNTNPDIKKYFDDYYNNYIRLLPNGQLCEDCKLMYNTQGIIEKIQVLSLLGALKKYFRK